MSAPINHLRLLMGTLRFSAKVGVLDGPSLACLKTLRHPASPASTRGCSTLSCDARRSQTGRYVKSQIKSTAKSAKQRQKPKTTAKAVFGMLLTEFPAFSLVPKCADTSRARRMRANKKPWHTWH